MRHTMVTLIWLSVLGAPAWAQDSPQGPPPPPAVPGSPTGPPVTRLSLDTYRDQRLVLYHTGPSMQWGSRRGSGRMVGIVEFAEAVGDPDVGRVAAGERAAERTRVRRFFVAGGATMAAGGVVALAQLNTDIELPPEPDSNPLQDPEPWAAWNAEREAIEATEDRRRPVNMGLRVGGLTVVAGGLALVGAGGHHAYRYQTERHLYMRHYDTERAKQRVQAHNDALAAELGIPPADRQALDARFPWRGPEMRPLE